MAKRPLRKIHRYPTDVSDEEWEFCASYLTLMKEDAPQREYPLRAVFQCPALDGARGVSLAAASARSAAVDGVVHQQTLRWIEAGCFEVMAHDLRMIRPRKPASTFPARRTGNIG